RQWGPGWRWRFLGQSRGRGEHSDEQCEKAESHGSPRKKLNSSANDFAELLRSSRRLAADMSGEHDPGSVGVFAGSRLAAANQLRLAGLQTQRGLGHQPLDRFGRRAIVWIDGLVWPALQARAFRHELRDDGTVLFD